MQVFEHEANQSRLVWITDLLPNEVTPIIRELVEQGSAAIKYALDPQKGTAKQ